MTYKVTFNNLDSALRAQKMFELSKQSKLSVLNGNFKNARNMQQELAKLALEDFETYKTLPTISIKNVPLKEFFFIFLQSLKFRIYKLFSPNSKEEKELIKKYSEYSKKLIDQEKQNKTINIVIPSLY